MKPESFREMYKKYQQEKITTVQLRESMNDELVSELMRTLDQVWFTLSGIDEMDIETLIYQLCIVQSRVSGLGGFGKFTKLISCLNQEDIKYFKENFK